MQTNKMHRWYLDRFCDCGCERPGTVSIPVEVGKKTLDLLLSEKCAERAGLLHKELVNA